MKIKILIIYFIIACVSIVSIFYIKNYFFYSAKNDLKQTEVISKMLVKSVVQSNFTSFKNYDGVVLSDDSSLKLDQFIQTQSLENKLVIHFWASWCDPCVNEIPELIEYINRNKKLIENNQLSVVLVSLDYDQESLNKFLISFPGLRSSLILKIWDQEGALQKAFDVDRLPSSFFINPDQSVEKYLTVVDWKRM